MDCFIHIDHKENNQPESWLSNLVTGLGSCICGPGSGQKRILFINLMSSGVYCFLCSSTWSLQIFSITPLQKNSTEYRIAGNFRGRKLSRIGGEQEIHEETFVECLAPPIRCECGYRFSRRKLSWVDTKPRNLQKFSPAKGSRHTVFIQLKISACTLTWMHDWYQELLAMVVYTRDMNVMMVAH